MSSLFGTMSIAVGALLAEQGALNATANNVANANTPGYSRLRPVLVEQDPVNLGSLTIGAGVSLQSLQSVRDPILELRLQQETQQQGRQDSLVSGMNQVQVMFVSSSGDIGTQLSNFFTAVNQLSSDPANLSLRQGVLTAAGNLANSFRTVAQNLTRQRQSVDLSVNQSVQQVNVLTGQIASLNGNIKSMEDLRQDASAFIDQRDVLIGQLSTLIDVTNIRSDNGLTLTTSNGTALVSGNQNFTLTTKLDVSGVQHIFGQGADITDKLTSGKLAGLLQVRDQEIPNLLGQLDTLAAGFANAINTAHRSGFDLSGNPGIDLFAPPPLSGQGAAANMGVAIVDPALVAASSDGSPGSNGNVNILAAVHDQPVASGRTATDFYAGIVFGVGSVVSNGLAEQSASKMILQQLQDERGSISGVSLDEEAANLIQYQRAYQASARVVSTINDILDTTINLGR